MIVCVSSSLPSQLGKELEDARERPLRRKVVPPSVPEGSPALPPVPSTAPTAAVKPTVTTTPTASIRPIPIDDQCPHSSRYANHGHTARGSLHNSTKQQFSHSCRLCSPDLTSSVDTSPCCCCFSKHLCSCNHNDVSVSHACHLTVCGARSGEGRREGRREGRGERSKETEG